MDDFDNNCLTDSKNEYCVRLVSILTPLVNDGFKSIYNEACKVCNDNGEDNKYLMTFQNYISRVPKWSDLLVEQETNRIIEESGCPYLEDLISCVHIIQLKILTLVRVGSKQKKIDISIPKLKDFIHIIYKNVSRKLYTNAYLYEKSLPPLQVQKNNREIEIIIRECIWKSIRDNVPVDKLLKAYLEESIEEIEKDETPAPPLNNEPPATNATPAPKLPSEGDTLDTASNVAPVQSKVLESTPSVQSPSVQSPSVQSPSMQSPSVPPPVPISPSLRFDTTNEVLNGDNSRGSIAQGESLGLDTGLNDDDDDDKIKIHDTTTSLDPMSVNELNTDLKVAAPDISLDIEVL